MISPAPEINKGTEPKACVVKNFVNKENMVLFFLQTQLSTVYSLVLSIPVGLALYVAATLALRVIHPQDLVILKGMQDSLPPSLRRYYAAIIRLAERLVGTRLSP